MDGSTSPFFEVTESGRVVVGENGMQQLPKHVSARGSDVETASVIPAGTSLVEVVLIENNGSVKLPIARIGTELALVKVTTNLTASYAFRIYPDNTTLAAINGQPAMEYLDVSATTKIVYCVAFEAFKLVFGNNPMVVEVKVAY